MATTKRENEMTKSEKIQAARNIALNAATQFGYIWRPAIVDGEAVAIINTDDGVTVATPIIDDMLAFYQIPKDETDGIELLH